MVSHAGYPTPRAGKAGETYNRVLPEKSTPFLGGTLAAGTNAPFSLPNGFNRNPTMYVGEQDSVHKRSDQGLPLKEFVIGHLPRVDQPKYAVANATYCGHVPKKDYGLGETWQRSTENCFRFLGKTGGTRFRRKVYPNHDSPYSPDKLSKSVPVDDFDLHEVKAMEQQDERFQNSRFFKRFPPTSVPVQALIPGGDIKLDFSEQFDAGERHFASVKASEVEIPAQDVVVEKGTGLIKFKDKAQARYKTEGEQGKPFSWTRLTANNKVLNYAPPFKGTGFIDIHHPERWAVDEENYGDRALPKVTRLPTNLRGLAKTFKGARSGRRQRGAESLDALRKELLFHTPLGVEAEHLLKKKGHAGGWGIGNLASGVPRSFSVPREDWYRVGASEAPGEKLDGRLAEGVMRASRTYDTASSVVQGEKAMENLKRSHSVGAARCSKKAPLGWSRNGLAERDVGVAPPDRNTLKLGRRLNVRHRDVENASLMRNPAELPPAGANSMWASSWTNFKRGRDHMQFFATSRP